MNLFFSLNRPFLKVVLFTSVSTGLVGISMARAESYVLFQDWGLPVSNYDEIVGNLKAGDRISFSDGKSFELHRYLNQGGNTKVYSIGEGKALRIPLMGGFKQLALMGEYVQAYRQLKKSDVPLARVYLQETHAFRLKPDKVRSLYAQKPKVALDFFGPLAELDLLLSKNNLKFAEYIVVQEESILFNGFEFWKKFYTGGCLDGCFDEFRALSDFFRSTWQFVAIGDFMLSQLGWTGERWVLLDYTNWFWFMRTPRSGTLVDQMVEQYGVHFSRALGTGSIQRDIAAIRMAYLEQAGIEASSDCLSLLEGNVK
jgi:hypothetical protein